MCLIVHIILFQDLGTRHAEEVEKLQRKLKWYAQNQDLLDQDLETIQKKDAEIKTLKERLTNTQAEVGQSCQMTLDISGSPIDIQWGSQKYPG